jgi:hypothetical protein
VKCLDGVLGDVVGDGIGIQRLAGGHDRVAADRTPVGLRAEAENHHLAAVPGGQGNGGVVDGGEFAGGQVDGVDAAALLTITKFPSRRAAAIR